MSTESHNTGQEPRHTDVSFEERDIKAGTIYGYLFALALAVVASFLICVYILRFTLKFAASSDTPPPPSREALGKDFRALPPEPRLQGVPDHATGSAKRGIRAAAQRANAAGPCLPRRNRPQRSAPRVFRAKACGPRLRLLQLPHALRSGRTGRRRRAAHALV